MFDIGILNKIDINILNIKYDVKSILEKLDKIHENLYSNNIDNKTQKILCIINDKEYF